MGHIDRRGLEPVAKPDQLGAQLHPELRVEVRQGLVHEKDLRLPNHCAAHGYSLALSSGERSWLAREKRLDAENPGRLGHPPLGLLLRRAPELQPESQVLL